MARDRTEIPGSRHTPIQTEPINLLGKICSAQCQRNNNQKVATPPSVRKAPPNKPIMSLSPIVMSVGDNTAIIRNLFVERLYPSGVDRTNPAFPIPGFGVAKCLRPSPMEWRHFFKIGKLRWFPAPSQFFRPQYDFIVQATTIRTDKEVAF
jgi:hypothetical protein